MRTAVFLALILFSCTAVRASITAKFNGLAPGGTEGGNVNVTAAPSATVGTNQGGIFSWTNLANMQGFVTVCREVNQEISAPNTYTYTLAPLARASTPRH